MTELTRRGVLVGTAATALASMGTTTPAAAAAPLTGKQVSGFYRYKVGDFELTAITDGARPGPLPDTFVRNTSKSEVNAALQASFLPPDQLTVPFTPVVINTGSKLVAIDTGLGVAAFDQSKGAIGQYHNNFAAAGLDHKAVDAVIISHFHGDHIGGLLGADGKLIFPNAEVMVPKPEWDYWMDEGNMSRAPEALKGNFANARRVFGAFGNKVTPYEAEKEVVPGIKSVATHGHTPGHMSYHVASGSGNLMVQSDVTAAVATLFVRNPGWHVSADMDGAMAEQTRRKLYDRVAADKMLVQGYHFPFPAIAHVEKDGNGYRLAPAMWMPTL
jgi:glyoxylase-like metal-dependent hydrolase (beta-lactamase superfamily II)